MAQAVVRRPLRDLNLCDRRWLDPTAFFHLRCGDALAPSPRRLIWQVGERAPWNLQSLDLVMCHLSRPRNEPGSNAADKARFLPFIETDQQGIEAGWLGVYPPITNSCCLVNRILAQVPTTLKLAAKDSASQPPV
jgi:hypothetical protein